MEGRALRLQREPPLEKPHYWGRSVSPALPADRHSPPRSLRRGAQGAAPRRPQSHEGPRQLWTPLAPVCSPGSPAPSSHHLTLPRMGCRALGSSSRRMRSNPGTEGDRKQTVKGRLELPGGPLRSPSQPGEEAGLGAGYCRALREPRRPVSPRARPPPEGLHLSCCSLEAASQ